MVGENQNNPITELTNENYTSLIFVCKQKESHRVLLRPMMNVTDCLKFLHSDFAVEKRKSRKCDDRGDRGGDRGVEQNSARVDLIFTSNEEQERNGYLKKRKLLNDDMFCTEQTFCLQNQVASVNKMHKKMTQSEENKNSNMSLQNELYLSTIVSVVNANFALFKQLQLSDNRGI